MTTPKPVARVVPLLLRRPHAVLTALALSALIAWFVIATPQLWLALHALLRDVVMQGSMLYITRPVATVAAFFLLYTLISAVSIPGGSVLAIGAGAVFGAVPATLMITLASTLGASTVFLLARTYARDRWRQKFPDWWHRIDVGVRHRGVRYLLLLRLAPLIPYAVVNPMMALTQMRAWTFFWVSALGMLPGSAAYALAGAGVSFWAQG